MKQHLQPTTVAILGADALAEDILARLLHEEGYATRLLESHPTGPVEELLDGVDVLLLAPDLKDGVRRGFLEAAGGGPGTAAIPVLSVPTTLKLALLDELSAGISWRSLLKGLVHEVEAALERVAAPSTGALGRANA